MSERKVSISASSERKLSHSNHGGAQYEMSSVWESEKVELPSDATEEEKEEARKYVRDTVNRRLASSVEAEIKRIGGKVPCVNPYCKREANTKYGDYCYQCNQAKKEGATIATQAEADRRKAPMPVDENGAPDFDKLKYY